MPAHPPTGTAVRSGVTEIVIRPNQSLSPRGNRLFFLLMAAVSLAIAGAFAHLGFWMILPFAGLELLLLGLALGLCCRRAGWREVVRIAEHTVEVRIFRHPLQQCWRSARAWTRVRLEPGATAAMPSRLSLQQHGRGPAIGACLTNPERARLARTLQRALPRGPACASA